MINSLSGKKRTLISGRCFSGLLILIAIALPIQMAGAVTVANYQFTGPSFASADAGTNWTTTDLTNGPGVPLATDPALGSPSVPSLALIFGDIGANLNQSLTNDDYYSFTVTPSGGYTLTFTQLDFEFYKNSGAGALVTASLFAGDFSGGDPVAGDILGSASLASGEQGIFVSQTIGLGGMPIEISTPTEFRLYLDNAGAGTATHPMRLDNIVLTATVNELPPIPEPSSFLLLGIGVLCLGMKTRSKSENYPFRSND